MGNGEWAQMEKLVLSKMHEHGEKLDQLHGDITALKLQVAIINDREDRELAAAKSVAVKWSTGIGALVSAIVSGIIGLMRGH
jgi:hypothetical protein